MNNIFSYHRFLLLLRKEAADLRPKLIRLMLVSFGIGLAIFLFSNFVIGFSGSQDGLEYDTLRFVFGSMVVLFNFMFAPFQLYKRFNHRVMGVNHFMLPASQLEKWIVMFVFCLIVTPVLIIAALTVADLCLLPFYPWEGTTLWFLGSVFSSAITFPMIGLLLLQLLTIQSVFYLCNIWFKESKVRKTFVIFIIIIAVNIMLSTLLSAIIFKSVPIDTVVRISGNTDSGVSLQMVTTVGEVYGSFGFKQILKLSLSILMLLGVWYASFLKWKEQEL